MLVCAYHSSVHSPMSKRHSAALADATSATHDETEQSPKKKAKLQHQQRPVPSKRQQQQPSEAHAAAAGVIRPVGNASASAVAAVAAPVSAEDNGPLLPSVIDSPQAESGGGSFPHYSEPAHWSTSADPLPRALYFGHGFYMSDSKRRTMYAHFRRFCELPADRLDSLRVLYFRLDPTYVTSLPKSLPPMLEEIDLHPTGRSGKLTGRQLEQLGEWLAHVADDCPNMRVLHVRLDVVGDGFFPPAVLAPLARMKRLQQLYWCTNGMQWHAESVKLLSPSSMPALRKLTIFELSAEGVQQLLAEPPTQLQYIDLRSIPLTAEEQQHFEQATPNAEVRAVHTKYKWQEQPPGIFARVGRAIGWLLGRGNK